MKGETSDLLQIGGMHKPTAAPNSSASSWQWPVLLEQLASARVGSSDFVLTIFGFLHLGWASTLAWKVPWTEEPGRLQSMGSRRIGHD